MPQRDRDDVPLWSGLTRSRAIKIAEKLDKVRSENATVYLGREGRRWSVYLYLGPCRRSELTALNMLKHLRRTSRP